MAHLTAGPSLLPLRSLPPSPPFPQGYGYEYLTALHSLEKCGLLKQQESKVFTTLKRQLKLVVPSEKGSELVSE